VKDSKSSSTLDSLRELFEWLPARRKRQFVMLLGASCVGGVAEFAVLGALVPFLTTLASPAAAGASVDSGVMSSVRDALAQITGSRSPVVPMGAVLIVLVLISTAVRLALVWATTRFAQTLGHDLATRLYRVTLDQPYSFHVSKNTSEIIAGVTKADALVRMLVTPFLDLIVATVLAAGIIAALLWVNWIVAISAAIVFGLIYITVSRISRARVVQNSRLIAAASTQRVRALQEGLGGIRDTILDGSQDVHNHRFSECDMQQRIPQVENALWANAPRFVVEGLGVVVIVVLAIVVTGYSGDVSASLPILGVVAMGAQRLLPLFQRIYGAWNSIMGSRGFVEDVFGLLELSRTVRPLSNSERNNFSFTSEFRLADVGFRYGPDGPWVFRGFSLTIPRGARLGFAGQTGCGKSTLLDLIMGLLEPTEGRLIVDEVVVDHDNLQAWRRHIAHVPQAIFLTDATIAENIAFCVPVEKIDRKGVEEAARRAQIHDFIAGLPQGYDTMVGERGVRLSGGQRQRIGIARALYRKADVLVLDEATSALDMETEASVMEGIDSIGKDITVLIVAHRLATLENCDRVIDMNACQQKPAAV
jgi:ABC-type multidrug transport system fused ATPase/permease subunit